MLQKVVLLFDPTKRTGTEGLINYKLSGFNSGKGSNGGGNNENNGNG